MSKLNLKRFKCGGCTEIILTNDFTKKCESCGSTLLEKQEVKLEDHKLFIESELEAANHHPYIELPWKLFKRLAKDNEEYNSDLARIITEEFYNNI